MKSYETWDRYEFFHKLPNMSYLPSLCFNSENITWFYKIEVLIKLGYWAYSIYITSWLKVRNILNRYRVCFTVLLYAVLRITKSTQYLESLQSLFYCFTVRCIEDHYHWTTIYTDITLRTIGRDKRCYKCSIIYLRGSSGGRRWPCCTCSCRCCRTVCRWGRSFRSGMCRTACTRGWCWSSQWE